MWCWTWVICAHTCLRTCPSHLIGFTARQSVFDGVSGGAILDDIQNSEKRHCGKHVGEWERHRIFNQKDMGWDIILLAIWPWARLLTAQSFCCLMCEMRIIMLHHRLWCRINGVMCSVEHLAESMVVGVIRISWFESSIMDHRRPWMLRV